MRALIIILYLINIFVLYSQNKKLTIDNIFNDYQFSDRSVEQIYSMADPRYFTFLEDYYQIVKADFTTGKRVDTLFTIKGDKHDISYIYEYAFSKEDTAILLATNIKRIYRYSYTANYYIYNLPHRTLTKVNDTCRIEQATWSPDSRHIAYIYNNNLFVKSLSNENTTQLTFDGAKNKIINGKPDWVYEEELSFAKAYEWSPNSQHIAYYRFNERSVPMHKIPVYNGLYPEIIEYHYPKAGEKNSSVSIHIYKMEKHKTQKINFEVHNNGYIPRICWTASGKQLGILNLNRPQNKLNILLANPANGKVDVIYSDSTNTFFPSDYNMYMNFIDQDRFITLSERDGYKHLYLYDINGNLINQITSGMWNVKKFSGYSSSKNKLCYTSDESSTTEEHAYIINPNGKDKKQLTRQKGTHQLFFNNNWEYYIDIHSDANTPVSYATYKLDRSKTGLLEDNALLKALIKEYQFKPKIFMAIRTENDVKLDAFLIKPYHFDSTKQYPLLIWAYGGPESKSVKRKWDYYMPWFQFLAQKGYAIACIDNRGTNYHDTGFRKNIYMQLGQSEPLDQAIAARHIGRLPYIDSNRIGIMGWSYGGYIASMCITKYSDVFKTGIAIAPVTNWQLYDNIYTERYMRKPIENKAGYKAACASNYADHLDGDFLIIHGTKDDNVHIQHTLQFTESLINEGKQFDMFIYPDKKHGLSGKYSTIDLYNRIAKFIIKNL